MHRTSTRPGLALVALCAVGCSNGPDGSYPVGDHLLHVDVDGTLELELGPVTWGTAPGHAIEQRTFDETVETAFGHWRFERTGGSSKALPPLSEVEEEDGLLRLIFGEATLTVQPQGGAVRFALDWPGGDGLALPVRCDPGGSFHGFGAQYHRTDHTGQAFDLLVREQGIGRDGSLFGFSGDETTSYVPMPWALDARGFGMFIDTDRRTVVDLCAADPDVAWFEVTQGDALAWEVLPGPEPVDVLRKLGARQGRPAVPPDWAFTGTWLTAQGGPDAVRAEADSADAAGIPTSALWVQDWTGVRVNIGGGYGVQYRWEPDLEHYPDISTFFDELHGRGVKVLGYVNPFVDPALQHWDDLEAGGMLPRQPGSDEPYTFLGPRGDMTTVDLSHPEARAYIKERLRAAVLDIGLDGWMADFAEWLPLDADIHEGDAAGYHNRYPVEWQALNREVFEEVRPDGDWVMFARSGWLGVQGAAQIHWCGDQEADFLPTDGLPTVVPCMLNLSLSGQPYVTHDIAGFSGGPSTPELYHRWTELGAFTPIMRTHDGDQRDANHRWDTDPETTAHFARFARIHAALGPELVALAAEAASGPPMVRHLLLEFPDDPEVWPLSDQYLLGPDLLVAPVVEEGATRRDVYLPAGDWYDVWTGERHSGPAWIDHPAPIGSPPVFHRGTDRADLRAIE